MTAIEGWLLLLSLGLIVLAANLSAHSRRDTRTQDERWEDLQW